MPLLGNELAVMGILAVIVGLASSLGTIAFLKLIQLIQFVSYGSGRSLLDTVARIPWYWRIVVPALGGLLVGLCVYLVARKYKGHGVAEVLEAVALRKGVIKGKVVLLETVAAALTIGTGGSAGIVGPIVQLGSGVGSVAGQIPRLSGGRIRTLVGCGAAAGIATAFNAPIAGVMFALEVILGDFGIATFSPIVISSVAATAVSRHFLGDHPAILVPAYKLVSAWELPLYVLLGISCALVAVAFTKLFYWVGDRFEDFSFPSFFKPLVGGSIIGITGLYFPHILGNGYPTIDLVLIEKISLGAILALMILKILSTSITIGSGGSGGTFAPALFIGAMAGAGFGGIAHHVFPEVTASQGAYSIVGMAALVAGITHAPLTGILMLFEMTGNYTIILPLMISCITASVLSGRLQKESMYTLKLFRKGVNIHAGKEVNVLRSIRVGEVMNPEVETVQEGMSLRKLSEKIAHSKYNTFPVVDREGNLTGILSFLDYHEVIFEDGLRDLVVTGELATRRVVTVSTDDSLLTALQRISSKDYSILPVVDAQNPTSIKGILTRRDIISAYNRAVLKRSVSMDS
ncbi:MAG: chloride channel protein [Thermodesulfobacteriota bacterium]